MLLGFFVGSVFFVRLGDLVGRRIVILVSTIVSTFALIGCQFLSTTVFSLFFYIFIFGVTIGPRCFLSYVLALELTPKEHHNMYCLLAMFFDSMCMVFLGTYFYAVKSMDGIMIGLIAIQVLVVFALWLYVPESPKFLYEKGQFEQFKISLKKIARVNGKVPEDVIASIDEVRNLDNQRNHFSMPASDFTSPKQQSEAKRPQNFGTINLDPQEEDISEESTKNLGDSRIDN